MHKKITVVIFLSLLNVLAGCGQKGALYLSNDSQTINSSHSQQHKDNFLIPQVKEKNNHKSKIK